MSDSKAPTPDSVRAEIRAEHEQGKAAAKRHCDLHTHALYEAREAVAAAYPGCQNAILGTDSAMNWDNGRLVQAEYAARKPK
jgi:hypothetical protein